MTDTRILEFLTELDLHNNRDWLLAHKDMQREAAAQFEELVQHMISELSPYDPSIAHLQAKDLTFRLNRDTRFSKDKSPYHAAFRAHIGPAGKLPIPVGYFVHIVPGNLFLGGGLFASCFSDATGRIRNAILEQGKEFLDIIGEPEFQKRFILVGEQLKRVPKGFDEGLPQSEYFKYKSLALEAHLPDCALKDTGEFLKSAVDICLLMKPFNDFLNRALEGFHMPERGPR